MSNKAEWIYNLKVGDKVSYEQQKKFSTETENIIAEVVETIQSGVTVARLSNGVSIDPYGNAIVMGCFGVSKVPAKLYNG